jgi:hypothetical protein
MKLELKSIEIGGYLISAIIEITIGDHGIGSYEFWGAPGIDSQKGIDEIVILEASYDPGQDDLPLMFAKQFLELEENMDELYEKADDAWVASEPEPPDHYDPDKGEW